MSNINLGVSQSMGYENVNLKLIKVITNEQGQKLVNARELYEVLKIQQDFTDWIKKQLNNVDAIKDEDYTIIWYKNDDPFKKVVEFSGNINSMTRNGNLQEYVLTLDIAKEVCMCVGVAPRTNEETRQLSKAVRKYFIECEKVAHNPYANLSPELQMLIKLEQGQTVLTQRVEEQKQDIVEVKQDVQNFKEEMPIFTSQRKEISKRVRALGVKLLGGKKSPAYQDKSLRAQVYSDINGQIHREFGVESCDDIKRRDYSAVFSIIHNYSLPTHLVNTIDYTNSQMSLGV